MKVIFGNTASQPNSNLVRQLLQEVAERDNYNNAVLALHALMARGDQAAVSLFSAAQCRAFLSVPDNYELGRRILVDLSVLPKSHSARG
jgi:hypothetical protein